MLKKIYISLLILCGIGLVIFIGYMLMIVSAFGGFDKDYSVSDLKNNFEKNQTEIYELKRYFNEIVPKNRFVLTCEIIISLGAKTLPISKLDS